MQRKLEILKRRPEIPKERKLETAWTRRNMKLEATGIWSSLNLKQCELEPTWTWTSVNMKRCLRMHYRIRSALSSRLAVIAVSSRSRSRGSFLVWLFLPGDDKGDCLVFNHLSVWLWRCWPQLQYQHRLQDTSSRCTTAPDRTIVNTQTIFGTIHRMKSPAQTNLHTLSDIFSTYQTRY